MSRSYFHFQDREEFTDGMWRIVPTLEREEFIALAADLMRRPQDFEAAMVRAIDEWPKSCEQNLRTPGLNRRAWMGHAGCCLGVRSSEDLTRLAWHTLNPSEQAEANAAADRAIAEWELRQRDGQLELTSGIGWPD